MRFVLISVSLVVVVVSNCYGENFSFCKSSGPDADKCLAKNIENAMHMLKSDIPAYGIKSFDPYPVDKVTIGAGTGAVQLIQHYRNIEMLGLTDVKIKKAHYDGKKKSLLFLAHFPKFTQQGDYTANGKILTLPLTGDGKSKLILENVDILSSVQFEEIQKGGQTFFKIKSFDIDITPERMRLSFENLFKGNKLLGDNMNKLINEEWKALYNDVEPSVEKSYSEIFKNYAQIFFDNVPVDNIFLKQ